MLWWRPNLKNWKPIGNADETDRFNAYKRAAKKLGVRIKIGYPIPCMAGADYCARTGMKGVYIERAQGDQSDRLGYMMLDELHAMSK